MALFLAQLDDAVLITAHAMANGHGRFNRRTVKPTLTNSPSLHLVL